MSQGRRCDIDKATLEDLYFAKRMSLSDVSRTLGVSVATVRNYIIRHGMKTRTPSEALATQLGNTRIGDWFVSDEKDWSSGHLKWHCTCLLCGVKVWVLARSLYSGTTARCNKCRMRLHRKGYETLSGTHWFQICESAKARDIPIDITAEYAWNLFQAQGGKCKLSGLEIRFGYKKATTASLDRIDSKVGYVVGNVQWIHKDINRMKWAFDQTYFIELCEAVADHRRDRSKQAP